jgi:hypothetical protein
MPVVIAVKPIVTVILKTKVDKGKEPEYGGSDGSSSEQTQCKEI